MRIFKTFLFATTFLFACNSAEETDLEEESVETENENSSIQATITEESEEQVQVTAIPNENENLIRLWIGLDCEQPEETMSAFAFSIDGVPVQVLESACLFNDENNTPTGGQFSTRIQSGDHVLRIDDQAHEVSAHERISTQADTWVRIRHRIIGNGHMTSILPSIIPDPNDLGDLDE